MLDPGPKLDKWAEWILRRRTGGDKASHDSQMRALYDVRDRVLDNAALHEGSVLLDVGTGDGLIAFGALERVGPTGRVIFSDVSADLLAVCRTHAAEIDALSRADFLQARAEDLSAVPDASVDAVTTRSVLIYVKDKAQAFNELYRVLKPGGRISLFEPINSFASAKNGGKFFGLEVTEVQELADKVRAVYTAIQGPDDPMLDFDERDLFNFVESAGFQDVHMVYEANSFPAPPNRWEVVAKSASNPLVPTPEEALARALTPEEQARYIEVVRPQIELGGATVYSAVAWLWATKPEEEHDAR